MLFRFQLVQLDTYARRVGHLKVVVLPLTETLQHIASNANQPLVGFDTEYPVFPGISDHDNPDICDLHFATPGVSQRLGRFRNIHLCTGN
jgi:hypothetical protein